MITHSGVEIPDPPTDPEERRRWKTLYFIYLYGNTKEETAQLLKGVTEKKP